MTSMTSSRARSGVYAERSRMAFGAGGFLLAALILPAVLQNRSFPGWLLGIWGLTGAAVLLLDGRVKKNAAWGRVSWAGPVLGLALLVSGSSMILSELATWWLSTGGILIVIVAIVGLLSTWKATARRT